MAEHSKSRWMVRLRDGVAFQFNKDSFAEKDEQGRRRFRKITYDQAVLIGQLPNRLKSTLYDESKGRKRWVLSRFAKDFFNRDARARAAFEQGDPEADEALAERKARLSFLMQDESHPLAYAMAELCFNPKSGDPRYAHSQNTVAQQNKEKVEADAGSRKGKPRVSYEFGRPLVRIMDLVRYLAEDEQKHYPVCDFLWRHAYRRIVAEKWMPESLSVTPQKNLPGEKTASDGSPATNSEFASPANPNDQKKTVAEELGVTAWHELDVICTVDGLRVKRKKGASRGRMLSWVALELEKAKNVQRLLLELAGSPTDGIVNPNTEAHRQLVKRANRALCKKIGLKMNPIVNEAGLRTRANLFITCEKLENQSRGPSPEDEKEEQDPEVMEYFQESNKGAKWEDVD